MAKILIAEDDSNLGELLVKIIEEENHHVDLAVDGDYAGFLLSNYKYDAAILDWEMPIQTGLEICKKIRAAGDMLPILFLTGRSDAQSRIEGLEGGADDYLCKPFLAEELLARVRAILRRNSHDKRPVLSSSGISYDPASGCVSNNGVSIVLRRKELAILEFFLRNPDRIFTLQQLLENVWPSQSDTVPETLRPIIKSLRDKLSSDSADCPIVTKHGRGYIFLSNSSNTGAR